MKKFLPFLVVLIVVAAAAAVALTNKDDENNTTPPAPPPQSQAENTNPQPAVSNPSASQQATSTDEVEIEDFNYSPATITVKKGTTVTWTNKDDVAHTVTADSSGGPNSELLNKDESYSFTFNSVGTFKYHCQPHPQMTGTVIVTE